MGKLPAGDRELRRTRTANRPACVEDSGQQFAPLRLGRTQVGKRDVPVAEQTKPAQASLHRAMRAVGERKAVQTPTCLRENIEAGGLNVHHKLRLRSCNPGSSRVTVAQPAA